MGKAPSKKTEAGAALISTASMEAALTHGWLIYTTRTKHDRLRVGSRCWVRFFAHWTSGNPSIECRVILVDNPTELPPTVWPGIEEPHLEYANATWLKRNHWWFPGLEDEDMAKKYFLGLRANPRSFAPAALRPY